MTQQIPSDPMSNLVRGIRKELDGYLATVLEKAVDEMIITHTQRDQIIDLANRDQTGRRPSETP